MRQHETMKVFFFVNCSFVLFNQYQSSAGKYHKIFCLPFHLHFYYLHLKPQTRMNTSDNSQNLITVGKLLFEKRLIVKLLFHKR